MTQFRGRSLLLCVCLLLQSFSLPAPAATRGYKNFQVAVYIPEYVAEQMRDPHLCREHMGDHHRPGQGR